MRFCLFAWLAFVSAGMFFALMTPLGEGIDEPAHFAYVQHVAQTGHAPRGRAKYVSEEVDRFLRSHPVSWSLHTIDPSLQSHDEYWQQGSPDRESRDAAVNSLRFSGLYLEPQNPASIQYESHQPPLYYAFAAPVFAAASRWLSFTDTFLITRIWSVLLASLVVPGSFLLARMVFQDLARESVLTLIVLFPGMYPGVVRVSNDALAAPLAAWFFFCLLGFLKTDRSRYFYGLSALAIAGLWTKAFFIPILAAAVLALFFYSKARSAVTLLLIAVLGWFWYLTNFAQSGSITGLPETVLAKTSIVSSAGALWKLDWENLLSVLRSSHVWIGNGSLLGVRSWMYRVFGWLFGLVLAGCFRRRVRINHRTIFPLAVGYAVFGAALIYFATQVFQQTGMSVIQGWYLTLFIPVEAVLFVAGAQGWFGGRWNWVVSALVVASFALLIYSAVFVALPYYAGITSHNPSGHLTTYHPALQDFSVMTHRLLRFQPAVPAFLPWMFWCLIVGFCIYSLARINPGARR